MSANSKDFEAEIEALDESMPAAELKIACAMILRRFAAQARECGERNQCDGCRVDAPLTERGNHAMPDGGVMGCTKDRYAPAQGEPQRGRYEFRDTGPLETGDGNANS